MSSAANVVFNGAIAMLRLGRYVFGLQQMQRDAAYCNACHNIIMANVVAILSGHCPDSNS